MFHKSKKGGSLVQFFEQSDIHMVISKAFKQRLVSHTSHQYIVAFLFPFFKSIKGIG
jgi:hypothetical protein